MRNVTDLSAADAKRYFLQGSSYFNGDFPAYISFEPILEDVAQILGGKHYPEFKKDDPDSFDKVNYSFVSNKDGRLAWRPLELMHPAIYVSLVNLICSEDNWTQISQRFTDFKCNAVVCCSVPVISSNHQSDKANQIRHWWQAIEQQSLMHSLRYSHLLHTDVTDCYGSLYTHSLSWSLHGMHVAKSNKKSSVLLGNRIDRHIQAGRYGQTNGISQGSILMDFLAELVLGYVDEIITKELGNDLDVCILRYHDDYRIFANSDADAEATLKIVSDKLRIVGMKLDVSKTRMHVNVVEGSVKPDKIAAIDMQDLGNNNAKSLQKQLLRLHSFGRRFPNSGALRRLVSDLHKSIVQQNDVPEDLEVQIAIATDIAMISPTAFPAIAGILSHLIFLASTAKKEELWNKVYAAMSRVPYNGYLQVWLQRVTKPKTIGLKFLSDEPLCKIVDGQQASLWENSWIASTSLRNSLNVSKIVIKDSSESSEVISPKEIELFDENAWGFSG